MSSKIFAPGAGTQNDVLRYCATNDARDWSTQDDAGFLPIGQHASVSPEVMVLGEYRGRLVVLTGSSMQRWTTDPDPAEMSLFDNIEGIGTTYADGLASVSGDLFFLTPRGVRTLAIAAGATNLEAGDVGTPIDELVMAKLAGPDAPLAFYYPGRGQFWLAFANEVFVYSQSKLGKVGAWSRYIFPTGYDILAATLMDTQLHLRIGNASYIVDDSALTDNGEEFEGVIHWPYLDLDQPGATKMLEAVDVVGYGECTVSIGYDQLDASDATYTTPFAVGSDTLTGGRVPLGVAAPSMAVKVVYAGGQEWQLNAVALYVDDFAVGW
jgi:hypothetical protein